MRRGNWIRVVCAMAVLAGSTTLTARAAAGTTGTAMDRDLMEIEVPKLEALYAAHTYTVTQVTRVVSGPDRTL